jgi:glycosyltransferase involved in cell wall biosynthesis
MGLQSRNVTLFLAAVALPPPLHGQSVINSAVIAHLACRKEVQTVVFDIGPGEYQSTISYHVNRVSRVLRAIAEEFRHANRPKRILYTVIESGWGRCYNVAIIAIARLLRFQIVLHHHTSAHTLNRSTWFSFLVRLAGRDTMHVVLGNEMASDLKKTYPSVKRTLVVHNSSFLSLPQDVSKVGSNLPRLTIGFLSNLTNEKGLDSVFDVLRFGRAEGLELKLKLGGPATNAKTAEQIRSAQLEFGPALEVLGPVGPSEKNEFFTSIDLFLFLSRYKFEAQPLVVLEAMSFGVPTIVSQRGYTSEIVGDAGHVILDQSAAVTESVSICRQYVDGTISLASQGSKSRARFVALHNDGQSGLQLLQKRIIEGSSAT